MNENPISELIDDELYKQLKRMGFLNERAIRDYYIRKKFNRLRGQQKPGRIIEKLREEFPYLSIESVRKIAYSNNGNLIPGKLAKRRRFTTEE